jgi:hypothetical protein
MAQAGMGSFDSRPVALLPALAQDDSKGLLNSLTKKTAIGLELHGSFAGSATLCSPHFTQDDKQRLIAGSQIRMGMTM